MVKSLEDYCGVAIKGTTRVVAIFGDPLTYTLSPKMHNFAFAELGLDLVYVPFVVKADQLAGATAAMRNLSYAGANVTNPHKQNIIPFLDEMTPLAKKIGAVNTIIRRGSKLIGDNTDAQGFIGSLTEDGHFNPKNKKAVLLGSGGVAYAISIALFEEGISKLTIINRTLDRALNLKAHLKANFPIANVVTEELSLSTVNSTLEESDLFINATPGGADLEGVDLPSNIFVFDTVYSQVTPLLLAAQRVGAPHLGGLSMLVRQGALSFSLWTGLEPPIDLMRKALS